MNPTNIRTNDLKSFSENTAGFTYSTYQTSFKLCFKMKSTSYINKTLNNKTLEN